MWIPAPIYERIPQFWVLISLLFMSSGVYLGFDYELTWVYFGTGMFCFAWGIRLFVMRFVYRKAKQEQSQEEQPDAA